MVIKDKLAKNAGIAMIMFVILFPLMIGFLGVGIDLCNFMYYNFKFRMCTRLAAVTGGSYSFDVDPDLTDNIHDWQIKLPDAIQLATDNFWFNMNGASNKITPDITLDVIATGKTMKVSAKRTVKFYFIPVIGFPSEKNIDEFYDVVLK